VGSRVRVDRLWEDRRNQNRQTVGEEAEQKDDYRMILSESRRMETHTLNDMPLEHGKCLCTIISGCSIIERHYETAMRRIN
jgi:hypothetical protein